MGDWIIRIGDTEHRTRTTEDLRQWRREGRIPDGAYIFHPLLERWLYAREVEELKGVLDSAPSLHPPVTTGSGSSLTANTKKSSGCLILIVIVAVLWFITSASESCSRSRARGRSAEAAKLEEARRTAEERRKGEEAEQRRTESIAALTSTSPLSDSETARHCEQLGPLSETSRVVLSRCAQIHVKQAAAAIKEKNFDRASTLADLAQAEGATAAELKGVRNAVERHNAAQRATAEAARRREDARI